MVWLQVTVVARIPLAQYRAQMNQHRKGYLKDLVISNSQCGQYHATLTGPAVNTSGVKQLYSIATVWTMVLVSKN